MFLRLQQFSKQLSGIFFPTDIDILNCCFSVPKEFSSLVFSNLCSLTDVHRCENIIVQVQRDGQPFLMILPSRKLPCTNWLVPPEDTWGAACLALGLEQSLWALYFSLRCLWPLQISQHLWAVRVPLRARDDIVVPAASGAVLLMCWAKTEEMGFWRWS